MSEESTLRDVGFDDIANLDIFFLRLQTATGITLYKRESVIVFDEIQLMPKVRQAIKYLVADGRYDYIETGSLISIKKNVKDIVLPSEEMKIQIYPMDYEEFMWAIGNDTYGVLRDFSFHYYEVDFLLASKTKIVPIEVKSSGIGKHESITEFQKKYSKHVAKEILLSQKDIGNREMLKLYPIYMLSFLIEEL